MASAIYENILREVEQLTDDEQHRLLETLKRRSADAPDMIRTLQESAARRSPSSAHECDAIDAWFARIDDLAERVSAAIVIEEGEVVGKEA